MRNIFIFLTFSRGTGRIKNKFKKIGNKLILFEISKMNNEMMSSVLWNILGWPGGNSSKPVR